jgi:hypothetical protein
VSSGPSSLLPLAFVSSRNPATHDALHPLTSLIFPSPFSSLFLILAQQALALFKRPIRQEVKRKPKAKALDEDVYVSAMEKIIRRDFFPEMVCQPVPHQYLFFVDIVLSLLPLLC